MKDINFDDIDKAVSAVLAPAKTSDVIDSTSKPPNKQVKYKTSPTVNSMILKRSGTGSFMDVVPPDSKKTSFKPKENYISHTPLTIKPLKTSVAVKNEADEIINESIPKPLPQNDTEQQPAEAPAELIDQPEVQPTPDVVNNENTEDQITPTANISSTTKPENELYQPPETAFLNDAKVEKRPLGAFSDTGNETDNSTLPSSTNEETADTLPDDLGIAQVQTSSMMPRELQNDILAVESDAADNHSREVPQQKAVQNAPVAALASSIHQQYQVQDSHKSNNDQTHSLYDINEYHTPIAGHIDQTHKHLALWVIIASLLLIATATGFGYWIYYGL